MKHLLNFVPATKFSGQSSFIYRTILGLMYALPLLFATYWTLAYWGYEDIINDLEQSSKRLEARHKDFVKVITENYPDREEIAQSSERITALYRSMRILEFSWTPLFALLEQVLPQGVRLERIRVRPGPVLYLSMSGEARTVGQVTGFLQTLFTHDRFNNPRLLRQSQISSGTEILTSFDMETEYLPLKEVRP